MVRTKLFQELTDEQIRHIFSWRNNESIRNWMKNSDVIPWEEHIQFISDLKESTTQKHFLVLLGNQEIGVVNLKRIDSFSAEGGLYKNPDIKFSVGNQLIQVLEEKALELGFRRIQLEVLAQNIRALHVYENNGYRMYNHKNDFFYMEKCVRNTPMVVAELSANHGHDINIAKKTIHAMAESGADAVKIQTYTADTITIDCANEYFRIEQGTLWDGQTLYDLYTKASTPWEWYDELRESAEKLGLLFFSTPFDFSAVDFLEKKKTPVYKIASFEITDVPLIEYTAAKGKPMIISTGIAKVEDVEAAVEACRRVGNNDITLLQCTSKYPAPAELANLRMIPNLSETFSVKSGLSDHTIGSVVPITATALGATIIEKHFILDRKIGGPDAEFSMEPSEFKEMVANIRTAAKSLGKIDYSLSEDKVKSRKFARSLFVVKNIKAGEMITKENIRSIRPSNGMHPKFLPEIVGRHAVRDLTKGEPLAWSMIE